MPYGTIKVDNITFTNGGSDTTITVSGLAASTTGNLTVTGTISGAVVRATTVSGVTVTGTTVQGASGTFTSITGGVATITSGVFALGSAAAPSISFSGDPNNGIYSPGADQVAISTNGTGRLFVDSSGRVGIGAASASVNFEVSQSGTASAADIIRIYNRTDGTSTGYLGLTKYGSTASSYGPYSANNVGVNSAFTQLNIGTETSHALVAYTNNTERLRITSAGLVGVGTSSPGTNLDVVVGSGTATQKLGSSSVTGGSYLNLHGASASKTWFIGANYNFAGVLEFTQSTANGGTTPSSTPAMVLSATGNVGIGTASPSYTLDTRGAIASTSAGGIQTILSFASDGIVGTISNHSLAFFANNAERARLDTSGRLLVGTSTARANIDYALGTTGSQLQIEQANATTNFSIVQNFDSGTTGAPAILTLARSGATSIGSTTIVANGNRVGEINFSGSDGTDFTVAACIRGEVDGTPGANDMPGRLVFSTTADGASSPTERLRITSAGLVGVGTSSPQATLDIASGTFQSVRTYLSSVTDTYHQFRGTPDGSGYEHARVFSGRDTSVHTYGSYLAFYTEGKSSGTTDTSAERLRIDSSGRVGIGSTSDPGGMGARLWINSTTDSYFTVNTTGSGSVSGINFRNSNANGEARFVNNTGGPLTFYRSIGNEAARIDSSGRLLVGTSSSEGSFFNSSNVNCQLEVQSQYYLQSWVSNNAADVSGGHLVIARSRGSTPGNKTVVQSGDNIGLFSFQGADGTEFVEAARIEAVVDGTPGANDMPGRLVFSTTADGASGPTERMRITNNGTTLFGGITAVPNGTNIGMAWRTTGDAALVIGGSTTSGDAHVEFVNPNGTVGSISTTGSATAYNTSSDYRLKQNVTACTDGIARLQQLKPSRFSFIAEPSKTVDGFIAHEVQSVVPEAITGEKDAVDDAGKPIYQGIDQSKLVPLLTAALQEAVARIEQLETAVAALQGS